MSSSTAPYPIKATHQQTRSYNTQLVLRTIFDLEPISRAQVARVTGLTPVSTSQMVTELMQDGLVHELPPEKSSTKKARPGRRPRMLGVNADGHHILALRLAIHEFRAAILNLRGEFIYRNSFTITSERGDEAVERIFELLDDLKAHLTQPLLGIGVASPGIVDPVNGIVRRSVFFGWNELELGSMLQERYDAPAYVANASQTAALAEYLFTDAPRDGNLAVVRVGQDVGVGLILDGQPYFGDGFGAGEMGHLVVEEDGEPCQCGNRGCLETIVSRNSVLRQAQRLSEQHPDSILAQAIEDAGEVSLEAVLSAYGQDDPYAQEIADRVADYVGRASASIVTLANVQRIHYVGSVTQFGETWLDKVRASMLKHAIPDLAKQTTTAIAQLGADAVILGAAALLMSRDLGLTLEIRR